MPLVRARVLVAARPLAPTFVRTIVPRRVRWHVRLDAGIIVRELAREAVPRDAREVVAEAVAQVVPVLVLEAVVSIAPENVQLDAKTVVKTQPLEIALHAHRPVCSTVLVDAIISVTAHVRKRVHLQKHTDPQLDVTTDAHTGAITDVI